ncbi:hypothetical protein PsorP6_001703 [Peronosclerospora sorghi]|uniref:Uncharacterized protein n=1 Tax=Peronosclerospora sorghi TaxID=230839 RepID=A0ACC0WXY5_9STRA|nr:hypothetical protein PsorP6_001703 [Peronosclerospora sorghi]
MSLGKWNLDHKVWCDVDGRLRGFEAEHLTKTIAVRLGDPDTVVDSGTIRSSRSVPVPYKWSARQCRRKIGNIISHGGIGRVQSNKTELISRIGIPSAIHVRKAVMTNKVPIS